MPPPMGSGKRRALDRPRERRILPDLPALRTRVAALCDAGATMACALEKTDLADRSAIAADLDPTCDAGEPVACLGLAWTMLPPGAAGLALPSPADGPAFRRLVQTACDAGLQRACTDPGWVHEQAIATCPHRGAAFRSWEEACSHDEQAACTAVSVLQSDTERLVEVVEDDGPPFAAAALAEQVPDRAAALYMAACTEGLTPACGALAATGAMTEAARAQIDRGCAAGDPTACARAATLDAAGCSRSRSRRPRKSPRSIRAWSTG